MESTLQISKNLLQLATTKINNKEYVTASEILLSMDDMLNKITTPPNKEINWMRCNTFNNLGFLFKM